LDDGGGCEETAASSAPPSSPSDSGRRRRQREVTASPTPLFVQICKEYDGSTLAGARLRRGGGNDGRRIGIALMVEGC
ncbi:hypothetical protein LINGRAHAP2_LOCUS10674, partial [Linum grandiflorum]